MTRVFPAIILVFFIGIYFIGCHEVDDYRPGERAEIPAAAYSITFDGGGDPVVFTHEKHSREYYGNACIACHDHEDVGGETRWYCRDCHTAGQDGEDLCDPYNNLGCVMTQCIYCHIDEDEDPPAPDGTSCGTPDGCHS